MPGTYCTVNKCELPAMLMMMMPVSLVHPTADSEPQVSDFERRALSAVAVARSGRPVLSVWVSLVTAGSH